MGRSSTDNLSGLSVRQLLDLWPGPIKGELTSRARQRGLTRSQLVEDALLASSGNDTKPKTRTRAQAQAQPEADKKLRVTFATKGESLKGECEEWLRENTRLPKYGLLVGQDAARLREVIKNNWKWAQMPGNTRRLLKELHAYAQELRDGWGLA